MTTATTTAEPAGPIRADEGGSGLSAFPRLLAMEWTKLRSVRSTPWSFAIFIVLTLGLAALLTLLNVSQWNSMDESRRLAIQLDPTGAILGSGFFLGQLALCVLGVLVVTTEYSTGMIRASLLAVPTRVPMLVAKVAVFAVVTFIAGAVVSFGAFFISAPILHSKVAVSIGDPGVLRALFGAGLYLMMLGLFALAIGALVRHTAAAITVVIGFVLVLAPLAQLLPGSVGKHIHAYLPSEAGHLVAQQHRAKDDLLGPWQGFGVFCLWTLLLLALAAYFLKERDA
jgi:ABC-type transport system involved in multi-copper enzyme maturation permease subunit